MPFDGTDFKARRDQPSRATRTQKAWAAAIIGLAALMLLMPVSAEGIVCLVRLIRGG